MATKKPLPLKQKKTAEVTEEVASPAALRILDEYSFPSLAEQYVRLSADFDNYRRRSLHELEEKRKSGIEYAIFAVLPVLDNLLRATSSAVNDPATPEGLLSGLAMVVKGFEDTLTNIGLEAIPAKGERFNPSIHEAIMS